MSEKRFALIGHPLAHSMSPFLHDRLFAAAGVSASYELLDTAPEALAETAERLRAYDGFNITIPYKEAILPFLDAVDEKAAFFRSVNTVKNEGGRLVGYTTDGDGFLFALEAAGAADLSRVLLLGCGGASRAMGGTALLAGAEQIRRRRSRSRGICARWRNRRACAARWRCSRWRSWRRTGRAAFRSLSTARPSACTRIRRAALCLRAW